MSDPTYYAYVINGPGAESPGRIDILTDSNAFSDACYQVLEFTTYVDNWKRDHCESETAGYGVISLFRDLIHSWPCEISASFYEYTVGVTAKSSILASRDDHPRSSDLVKEDINNG